MPTFPAPYPVPVVVDVPFASLYVVAAERDDVVVTVLPAEPSKSGSVRAAEEIRVDRNGDAVTITYPGSWKQWVLPFAAGTAEITVELPAGSDLRGKTGQLYTEGRLGTVELTLNSGDVRVDEADRLDLAVSAGSVVVGRTTGPTHIKASAGSVVVGRTAGTTEIRASAGSVRVDEVAGDGTIRAANGTTTVESVSGSLNVTGAHADIAVSRVRGTLTVKSAHAGIRVGRLESGDVTLTTSYGSIEVGVPEGTAALLDVASQHGAVRNHLTPTQGPVENEATAEIHANTGYGDVIVRRPEAITSGT
jgi:Putative adhesin